jgi:two-component system, LytTR family, response regulator
MTNSSNKLKVIIVDDEKLARKRISDLLLTFNESLEIIRECKNGNDAIRDILLLKPNLVFLDVQMPDINGYEVLERISRGQEHIPAIIFTTAYDIYAVKAFEVNAIDYLLKPYTDDRFIQAIHRVKENWVISRKREVNDIIQIISNYKIIENQKHGVNGKRITLKHGNSIFIKNIEDIDWIEAYGEYVKIHIKDAEYLKRISLKEMHDTLSEDFSRVHRSFIVNKGKIVEIRKALNGFFNVFLIDGTKLRISPNYKEELGL